MPKPIALPKHEIAEITVVFTMPDEWGNCTTVVDMVNHERLIDLIKNRLEHYIRIMNFGRSSGSHLRLLDAGYYDGTIEVTIPVWEKGCESYEIVVESLQTMLYTAYMMIPYRQRKRAKA